MLTFISASLVAGKLGWLIRKRPAAALAGVFLLWSLLLRVVAQSYLDFAGPVHAEQLGRNVGGSSALPVFALVVLAVMAGLSIAFRPAYLRRIRPPHAVAHRRVEEVSGAVFLMFGVLVALLYVDMLRSGSIPLFSGVDRMQYTESAGVLHRSVLEFGFLLGATLGYMFVRSRVRGGDFDFRFLGLYVILGVYLALTGHRFSAMYTLTSFAVIPLAAIPALAAVGKLTAAPRRSGWKAFICSPFGLTLGALGAAGGLVWLILNSVVNVRQYANPYEALRQRILIQPVETWTSTWERLGSGQTPSFERVWNAIFVDPIDPTRNTSIQWIMEKELGYARAAELLGNGQIYAGGYPEVFFDLFGPWFALVAVVAFIVPTVLLLRLIVRCSCEGRFWTMFVGVYIYYGFTLLYVGGMLNFLTTWTYWAKLAVLTAAYVVERGPRRAQAGTAARGRIAGAPGGLGAGGISQ